MRDFGREHKTAGAATVPASEASDSAFQVLGNDTPRGIARELVATVRTNEPRQVQGPGRAAPP
jgi:hypothetical protein